MNSLSQHSGKYELGPSLMDMHKASLEWISSSELWKQELNFFQKLLDKYSTQFTSISDKKQMDHFQNLIIYYSGEVVDTLKKKVEDHDRRLADIGLDKFGSDASYYEEQKTLIDEIGTFKGRFISFKTEFYKFIEQALK